MLSSASLKGTPITDARFTAGPELIGAAGPVDLVWRLEWSGTGNAAELLVFATSPVDAELTATVAAVSGV